MTLAPSQSQRQKIFFTLKYLLFWGILILINSSFSLAKKSSLPSLKVKSSRSFLHRKGKLTLLLIIKSYRRRIRLLRFPHHRAFRLIRRERKKDVTTFFGRDGRPQLLYTWTYKLIYKARRVGKFRFSPAKVRIGRRLLKSSSLKIEVLAGPAPSTQFTLDLPKTIRPRARSFILATVSPSRPFLYQQAVVSYFLFARDRLDFRYAQLPKLTAFWKEEIFKRKLLDNWKIRYLAGKKYRYLLLLRYAIFPMKTGRLEIDPLSLHIIRNLSQNTDRSLLISSPSRWIFVRPLPSKNRPKTFSETNVGHFRFQFHPSQSRLQTGQAFYLKIKIQGKGPIQQLQYPTPKVFPKKCFSQPIRHVTNKTTFKQAQIQGALMILFQWTALQPGRCKVLLPPFQYFDPNQERYITLTQKMIPLEVLGKPFSQTIDKKIPRKNPPKLSSQYSYLLQILSLLLGSILLFLFLSLFIKKRKKQKLLQRKQEQKQLEKQEKILQIQASLKQISLSSQWKKEDYKRLELLLLDLFELLLQRPTKGLKREELYRLLQEKGWTSLLQPLRQLLDKCDRARFAPTPESEEDHQSLISQLQILLNSLPQK